MLSWLRAKVGDTTATAIVATTILTAVGTGIVGLTTNAFDWVKRKADGGDLVRFMVREKATSRPLDGAIISILSFDDPLAPMSLREDGARELVTRSGLATARVAFPRGDYVLMVKYKFEGREYVHTEPLTITGPLLSSIEFSPDHQWLAVGGSAQAAQGATPVAESPVVQTRIVQTIISRSMSPANNPEPTRQETQTAAWMDVASKEIGQSETPDETSNPRILEYLRSVGTELGSPDENIPWNSAFANWALKAVGIQGANSHVARSWLQWGRGVDLQPGCIAVFWRGTPTASTGHVGFYIRSEGDSMEILGGNQNNGVNISRINAGRFLGCRMPVA